MKQEFSLLEEPWICVRLPDCSVRQVSIREALLHAQDFAGLAGYYDERSFFLFGLRKGPEGCTLEIAEQIGSERRQRTLRSLRSFEACLSAEGRGLTRALYLCDGPEKELLLTLRADYLSDEGLTGGKRFTGAALGLMAVGTGTAVFSSCSFRFQEAVL